jgi:hypothetical protein
MTAGTPRTTVEIGETDQSRFPVAAFSAMATPPPGPIPYALEM